jgi:hypothetical protein
VTKILTDDLVEFDAKLNAYRIHVSARDVEPILVRLDTHAHLAMRLHLKAQTSGKLCSSLGGASRRGSLASVIIKAQSHEQVANQAYQNIGLMQRIDAAELTRLNRAICGEPPEERPLSTGNRSNGNESVSSLFIRRPSIAIARSELNAWLTAFDPALWTGIHPLVHATLAASTFVAGSPFGNGNGRMAGTLFVELLRARGIPVLSWNTGIEHNYGAFQATLLGSLETGDFADLVRLMLEVGNNAISFGLKLCAVLVAERAKLVAALTARPFGGNKIDPSAALDLAADILSGILVEGFLPRPGVTSKRLLLADLAGEGHLDLVATPHGVWASVGSIRRAMIDPG